MQDWGNQYLLYMLFFSEEKTLDTIAVTSQVGITAAEIITKQHSVALTHMCFHMGMDFWMAYNLLVIV